MEEEKKDRASHMRVISLIMHNGKLSLRKRRAEEDKKKRKIFAAENLEGCIYTGILIDMESVKMIEHYIRKLVERCRQVRREMLML